MVGVPLTKGQHVVEYVYRSEALALGGKISLVCAAMLGLLIWKQPKASKRGKYER